MPGVKDELQSLLKSLSIASTIALAVVFSVFAGTLFGYWLDTKVFGGRTSPWLTVIFLIFGIGGAVKNFVILARRYSGDRKGQDGEAP